jgi:hypothetical protein
MAIENFVVTVPSTNIPGYILHALLAGLLAAMIVVPVFGKNPGALLLGFFALFMILYIAFENMTGENKASALPYHTYPAPPHLGLDGVSMEVTSAGQTL